MTILVLGWSSIARRRVMPALASLGVTTVDVASLTQTPQWPDGTQGRPFASYDAALRDSAADVVYVSTRNHEHHRVAKAALESGRHVIVDKPATLSVTDAADLLDIAATRQRLIAEATVYPWHPQFRRALESAAEYGPVTHLSATFSFPPLPASNVRLRPEWGGGAIWDLGPYAVSAGRLFFGGAPERIVTVVEHPASSDVDTAFSVVARYPGNRTLVGHFGMTTAYVNRLEVLGPRLSFVIEPAFTTAPGSPCRVAGTADLRPFERLVPPADAFALFSSDVFSAIVSGDHGRFAEALRCDAHVLDQLRSSRA